MRRGNSDGIEEENVREMEIRRADVLLALAILSFCAGAKIMGPISLTPSGIGLPSRGGAAHQVPRLDIDRSGPEKESLVDRGLSDLLFGGRKIGVLVAPYAVAADRENRLFVTDTAGGCSRVRYDHSRISAVCRNGERAAAKARRPGGSEQLDLRRR